MCGVPEPRFGHESRSLLKFFMHRLIPIIALQVAMAQLAEKDNQTITELYGIEFPLHFTFEDRKYPACAPPMKACMVLYPAPAMDLNFRNEKGNWSGKHARYVFSVFPGCLTDCAGACIEFGLRVENFHCTGNWGIWMGYGRKLEFACTIVDNELICKNLECADVPAGRITMTALIRRGTKRPPTGPP